MWRNAYVDPDEASEFRVPRGIESVRLATVQFQARAVKDFAAFIKQVEYFVDVAADYRSDFVTFPELFSLPLLSFEKKSLTPMEAIDRLTEHRQPLVDALSEMALRYNINIIGGSHPTLTDDGDIHNVAYVCLRDGSVHAQEKIHPTPNEAYWWKIKGGDSVDVIQTDCGPIGVLICYDSEFPELARRLCDEGARILFVPFCTDSRQGYMRVRYCSQARAIENQCFVVMSGNVGNLPGVDNMDIQYAQSCIITPCDFPFGARRHRGGGEREYRNADDRRREPRRPDLGTRGGHGEEPRRPPLRLVPDRLDRPPRRPRAPGQIAPREG